MTVVRPVSESICIVQFDVIYFLVLKMTIPINRPYWAIYASHPHRQVVRFLSFPICCRILLRRVGPSTSKCSLFRLPIALVHQVVHFMTIPRGMVLFVGGTASP